MAISLLMLARRSHALSAGGDPRFVYGSDARSGPRLVSGALAMAVAGGIGATLMLALVAPQIVPRIDEPFVGRNIPLVEPTPPRPREAEQPRQQPESRWTIPPTPRPLPPVGTAPQTTLDPGPTALPGTDIGLTGGNGAGDVIIPEPRPEPRAEPVFRDATRDPRFIDRFQPNYPPSLERLGVEGMARVRVRIGTDGRVVAIEDLGSTDPAFFAATRRQALERWRFRPATRDGVPVESTQVLTVTFRMPVPD